MANGNIGLPQHEHGCGNCEFLGRFIPPGSHLSYDCYHCEAHHGDNNQSNVIVRWGIGQADEQRLHSAIDFGPSSLAMIVAYHLASIPNKGRSQEFEWESLIENIEASCD